MKEERERERERDATKDNLTLGQDYLLRRLMASYRIFSLSSAVCSYLFLLLLTSYRFVIASSFLFLSFFFFFFFLLSYYRNASVTELVISAEICAPESFGRS